MKVSEIGEFGLIDRLGKIASGKNRKRPGPGLVIGIGDDAAAWKTTGGIELATVDSYVENVHFTTDTAGWRDIGWKALAINLSDIAAMGGKPRYILIALSLPADTDVANIDEMYRGLAELADNSGAVIAGGNISGAPQVSITITVIGESAGKNILRRSAARPDDLIAVTGWPGSAAGGLAMLMQKLKFKPKAAAYFRGALVHPVPRLKEGQALVKHGIKAAIDTSDGLIADLGHICKESGVSARIIAADVPLHALLKENFGEKAPEMTLGGGEDYELLFTGKAEAIDKIKNELKCPVNIIGEIRGGEPGRVDLIGANGKPLKLKKAGWTHF